ncbi:MAG: hypothetical protein KC656_31360, partial [Myxococcales bacterium]|nr:hypothetical protein [Myxococcales bacterium]
QSAGTLRRFRGHWQVGVELRWSPVQQRQSAFNSAYGDVASADLGLDLSVLDDLGGPSRTSAYAGELTERIVALVEARSEAVQRRAEIAGRPLLETVLVELRVQEIEGELDALTDGGVSGWRQATPAPKEKP